MLHKYVSPSEHTKKAVLSSIAWTMILISSITLIGYFLKSTVMVGWNLSPGMAINTAVCFLLTGLAILIIAKPKERPKW